MTPVSSLWPRSGSGSRASQCKVNFLFSRVKGLSLDFFMLLQRVVVNSEQELILTASFYDMNQKILTKKGYFQNFSWFQLYTYKLCMIYVHWHCFIDCCVKSSLVDKTSWDNCFYFTLKWFLLNFLGNVLLRGELQKMQKKFEFWNFLKVPSIWNLGVCL